MSPEPSDLQIPPPKDWQAFERHMRDLLEADWGPPVEMHGRSGQPQRGVDIYGRPNGGKDWHGVQCKQKDGLCDAAVTGLELREEVKKAEKFKPKLGHFILATTGPRDVKVQAVARELTSAKRAPFSVQVMFWDDVLALYNQHPEVLERHYPNFRRRHATRLHQIQAPVQDFTGRVKELETLLKGIQAGATISGMQGLGGIGKTELARMVASKVQDRYPDAQFVVELKGSSDTPLSSADALARVIQSVHPDARLPEDEADLRKIYLSVLDGMKAIILAADAASDKQVRPLMPPPSCLLLVTSRKHFVLPGLTPMNLDCLTPQDAADLLLKICPRLDGCAGAIAHACGRLPLALRAAASLLAVRPDIRPEDYIRDLAYEKTRLEKIGDEDVDRGVEASLMLSYRQLPAETARVFCQLAVFPGTFDAAAEEVVCQDKAHEHLGRLLRYSLAEYDENTSRWRLHDLVRVFAAIRLDAPEHAPERPPAEQRFAEHHEQVLSLADDLFQKGGDQILKGLSLFDRERHNIEAGQRWAAAHADAEDAAARLAGNYPGRGAYVLNLRLHARESIRWLDSALAAARRLGDRRAEAGHLGNLGLAYADLGEVRRAIEYYEQGLVIDREIGNRRGEGNALGNLGLAYADLGEVRRAIEYYERCLTIYREIGDRLGEGAALGNLGSGYYRLGDVRRAIEYYEQCLTIHREIGDRRGEGADLGNLGLAYAALGEVRRAIEYYEQGLVIDREIGDRRGEGADLGNLGLAYAGLGEVRRAIECHEQALVIDREIGDRRGEGNALGNLGIAYADLGEVRRAIEYYEQQLTIVREIGDRRGEGAALGNLGVAYKNLGEVRRAIEYYEQQASGHSGDRRPAGGGQCLGQPGDCLQEPGRGAACDRVLRAGARDRPGDWRPAGAGQFPVQPWSGTGRARPAARGHRGHRGGPADLRGD